MLIVFDCSACSSRLEIEADRAGTEVECPTCGGRVVVPRKGLEEGTTIGGFRIERLLGKGGMGEVYLARQLSLDRLVALKILPSNLATHRDVVERFVHEVKLSARLEHPNLVTAYEAGEDSGVLYLAMAYVKGETLHERIRRLGRLPEAEALVIARKIAAALSCAWDDHRLLHRDVKPSNILLDARDEPRLADLGLAKCLDVSGGLTISGAVMGTPNYMSPEQADGRGDVDFRSDIFSLGATLYSMLTGRIPFEGRSLMETLRRQATEPLPDPRADHPGLSPATVALLEVMLARDPAGRPVSWGALIADIDRALAKQPPAAAAPEPGGSVLQRRDRPVAPSRRARRFGRPRPAAVVAVAAALGAALAAAVYSAWRWGAAPRPPEVPPAPTPPAAAVAGVPTPAPDAPASAPRPAEAPPSLAPLPVPAADSEEGERVRRLMEEARTYAAKNPDDVGGLLKRYDAIRSRAGDAPRGRRGADWMSRVAAERAWIVDRARYLLRTEVERAIAEGRFDDARRRLRDEKDPFALETAALRSDLLRAVERAERERAAASAAAARPSPVNVPAVLAAAVADALHGNAALATARLAAARAQTADAAARAELDRADAVLRSLGGVTPTILGSFEAQIGRDTAVEFEDGRRETVRVVAVEGGRVRARRTVPQGFVEIDFGPADLSARERWARVGADGAPEACALRGAVALGAGSLALAEQEFARIDGEIGRALAEAIRAVSR